MVQYQMESLPEDKQAQLRKWLQQSEYKLLREQIIALAVQKEVEASAHHARALDKEGAALEEANAARAEAKRFEETIELLDKMRAGESFEFKRVKVNIPKLMI